jgi:hypothetical protein
MSSPPTTPTSVPTSKPKSHARWVVGLIVESAALAAAVLRYPKAIDAAFWLILVTVGVWRFRSLKTGPSDKDKEEQKRREEKESHELPSPLYEAHRVEKWFELKKLEYEKAAERYDNIYRAVWQNFSYLAVLAGGILAFGAKDLSWAAAYFLSLTPLAFWYIATFLPMDHYGDETRKRLLLIEDEINEIYFPKPTDPKLRHFTLFRLSKYKWRVQNAVNYFGVVVCAFWVLMGVLTIHRAIDPSSGRPMIPSRQTVQLEPQPFHVEMRDPATAGVRDSLAMLSRRVQSIDSILRCRPAGARGRPVCNP